MTLSLVLRPLAMLGLTMLVPQGTPATGDAPEDTLFVRFREGSGHTVRGPQVSSSSGYRAYVTVTAEMRRLEGWPTCVNTASLFCGLAWRREFFDGVSKRTDSRKLRKWVEAC